MDYQWYYIAPMYSRVFEEKIHSFKFMKLICQTDGHIAIRTRVHPGVLEQKFHYISVLILRRNFDGKVVIRARVHPSILEQQHC